MPKRTELIYSSKRKLVEDGKVSETFAAFALPNNQSKFLVARVRMNTNRMGQPAIELFTLAASGEIGAYDAPISYEQLITGQAPKNYPLVDVSVVEKFFNPDREI